MRADRAEHQLAIGVAVEQIEDLPLVEILADDLAVGHRVDAEQRLVDMERAADRLHRAAGAEQKQRVGPRLDLLAQVRGDVLLDGLLVRPGDQRLGALHIGSARTASAPTCRAAPPIRRADISPRRDRRSRQCASPISRDEVAQQNLAPCAPA